MEFAIVGALFFGVFFGVFELGRLLYTHNELVRATRRAARYAVLHPNNATENNPVDDPASMGRIQKLAIYGKTNPNTDPFDAIPDDQPLVKGLRGSHVEARYSTNPPFGVNSGSAEVEIDNSSTGYRFNFIVPLLSTYSFFNMPSYKTTLPAESIGCENVNANANANPCS